MRVRDSATAGTAGGANGSDDGSFVMPSCVHRAARRRVDADPLTDASNASNASKRVCCDLGRGLETRRNAAALHASVI